MVGRTGDRVAAVGSTQPCRGAVWGGASVWWSCAGAQQRRFPCQQHKHQEICGNIQRDKLSVPQWGNPFTPIRISEPKALNNRNRAGGFGWALIEVKEAIHTVTDIRGSKENNCPACEPDSRFPCWQHKHQEIRGNIQRIILPTNSHQLGGHNSRQYSQGPGCSLNETPPPPRPRHNTSASNSAPQQISTCSAILIAALSHSKNGRT